MSLDAHRRRFLRFLATGVVNTGFGYGVFAAAILAGAAPALALALQFALGIPFNYALHGRYVFGVSGLRRLPLYALAYLALYGVNLVALDALRAWLAPLAAQALLLLPMAVLSYLVISRLLRPEGAADVRP